MPLPEIKIKVLKTPNGHNTGVLSVANFAGSKDIKEKMRRMQTKNDNLDGSIDGSNKDSSFIGSELNRKITDIKKQGGAWIFHVRRHSGEALI